MSTPMERSLPARFPAGNAWPAEMRADMAAAFFDFETTGKLMAAIQRGEVSPPTASRIFNARRIPIWSRAACDAYIEDRHGIGHCLAGANDNRPVLKEVEFA